ncbi:MAG: hypothetical protein EOO75_13820 [Myxococcales bacterium]|nr:MAG: hypothetical protein EOO75_13820 [Myxococcales bacterium]
MASSSVKPDLTAAGRHQRVRLLTRLNRDLCQADDMATAMRLGLAGAAAVLDQSRAMLVMSDEQGVFVVEAVHGIEERALGLTFELGALMPNLTFWLGVESSDALIAVPLVVRGRVAGVLAVNSADDTDENEWLLSTIADQVAFVWETTRLHRLSRHQEDRLREHEQRPALEALRQLVERHGGTLVPHPDSGLDQAQSFIVRLPRQPVGAGPGDAG